MVDINPLASNVFEILQKKIFFDSLVSRLHYEFPTTCIKVHYILRYACRKALLIKCCIKKIDYVGTATYYDNILYFLFVKKIPPSILFTYLIALKRLLH